MVPMISCISLTFLFQVNVVQKANVVVAGVTVVDATFADE
jgi:hypothetical protein